MTHGSASRDCWPLSGTPVVAGADVARRTLLVKIDNAPAARPQFGLGQADLVFETLVEGYVTRYAAAFHSQDPQMVAPVRSARLTDRSLAPMVEGALVFSGTSAYELPLIQRDHNQGRYMDMSADYNSGYGRLSTRPAPSNLFVTMATMRGLVRAENPRPVQVPRWSFIPEVHDPRAGGFAASAVAAELVIPYREDLVLVTYRWNPALSRYARWQNVGGRPVQSVDAIDSKPLAVANVVVLHTDIIPAPQIVDSTGAISYDARLTGTGKATVFRDALRQEGTWTRANDSAAFSFKSAQGEEILLAPGQTWVHPIPADWVIASK